MANFFTTDADQIRRRVESAFDEARSGSGELLFPRHRMPGTPGYNLKELLLQEVVHWHREANQAFESMSPETAAGIYLDQWADFFEQPRGGLRYAKGAVRISAEVEGRALENLFGTRELPENAVLETPDGTRLRLTDRVELPENRSEAPGFVQAEEPGPRVRVPAGTELTAKVPQLQDVLAVTASEDIAGGSFEESDEQLRYRLVRALTSPTTFAGLRTRLLSHPDVSEAALSNAAYGPGTVEAFVTPALSIPSPTLRSELEALWQGTGNVFVAFPSYEGLQLRVRVGPDGATGLSAEQVASYVNNLELGEELVLNALETRMQNAGAADAQVVAARRGLIDTQTQRMLQPNTLRQITNLSPEGQRVKWFTKPEWITFCS